jgi:hypothetical protein
MKLFPIRYWWADRTGEHSATTVAIGTNAADALARFRRENPHLSNAAIISHE